jgi:hypothetical protein
MTRRLLRDDSGRGRGGSWVGGPRGGPHAHDKHPDNGPGDPRAAVPGALIGCFSGLCGVGIGCFLELRVVHVGFIVASARGSVVR